MGEKRRRGQQCRGGRGGVPFVSLLSSVSLSFYKESSIIVSPFSKLLWMKMDGSKSSPIRL